MMRTIYGVVALGVAAWAIPALAQEPPPPPPPISIPVPDLAAEVRPLGDERTFFIFHRAATSFDEAHRDLAFCFRYAQTGPGITFPYFYGWQGTAPGKPASYDVGQFGLVGSLIGAMIAGGLERSKRQMNMMHCMIPRGYSRYRVSEGLWKELNGKDMAASIEVQSRLASGPTPSTPAIFFQKMLP